VSVTPAEIELMMEDMTDAIAAGLNEILTALRNDRPLHAVDWERHLTEAISRLAALSLPEDQVKKAAEIIANSPLIDAPKLPAECWQGLARSILEVRAPPLPEEIAGLIKRADDAAINTDDAEDRKLFANLGDAIRALARENGKLNEEFESERAACGEAYRQREELRAERDRYKTVAFQAQEMAKEQIGYVNQARAERDGIRAKTFEECAKAAFAAKREDGDEGSLDFDLGFHAGRCNAGEAIRALTHTDESKTKPRE
jgi:hypothetical protein